MPTCKNPECGKEILEGRAYCGEACQRRYHELKRLKQPVTEIVEKRTNEEDILIGQGRRKRAMEIILKLARELCPMQYKRFASEVSYRTGLSLRKIEDDYLEVLLQVGLLRRNDNILTLPEAVPK